MLAGKQSGSVGRPGKLSTETLGSKVVNNLIVSQHQKFAKSLEPRRPGITNGVRAPTVHSECIAGAESGGHQSREGNRAATGEHAGKKSSSWWLFKWTIWGSKPAAKVAMAPVRAPQPASTIPSSAVVDEPRALSPTAAIMSDARDAFCTKSDRYSSGRVGNLGKTSTGHRRGSSWGCASLASTAAITPIQNTQRSKYSRIHQDDNDGGNTIESRVGSMDGSQSFRNGESFRSTGGQSFRSSGGQSFRKSDSIFEDCHGSFRSIVSGGSCASFRSVEEIEWDSRLPPPLPADQTLTIGDVAALCNSSLKFVFKCREIQHFNKFLRSQKARLLSAASEKGGNTDRFEVILSGSDIGTFFSSAFNMIFDSPAFFSWMTLMDFSVGF